MKIIKNRKITNLSLAFLCALTITGCNNGTSELNTDSSKSETCTLEEHAVLESNQIEVYSLSQSKNNTSAIEKEDKILYSVFDSFISISKCSYGDYDELSYSNYQELNEALKSDSIDTLMIDGIDTEIDFSKLNLENIKWIYLNNIGASFPLEMFHNKTYEFIELDQKEITDGYITKINDFFNNVSLKDATININLSDIKNTDIEQELLDTLANRNNIRVLTLYTNSFESLDMSKLRPMWLCVCTNGKSNDINMDVDLNDAVYNFTIQYCYPDFDITPVIKSINACSNNEELLTSVYIFSQNDKVKGKLDENLELNIPIKGVDIQGIDMINLPLDILQKFKNYKLVNISDGGLEPTYAFFYNSEEMPFIEAVLKFDNSRKTKQKTLINSLTN